MAKTLTLINPDHEPTPEEIYMARISQEQSEYRGQLNAPWKPFAEKIVRPLIADEILERADVGRCLGKK